MFIKYMYVEVHTHPSQSSSFNHAYGIDVLELTNDNASLNIVHGRREGRVSNVVSMVGSIRHRGRSDTITGYRARGSGGTREFSGASRGSGGAAYRGGSDSGGGSWANRRRGRAEPVDHGNDPR